MFKKRNKEVLPNELVEGRYICETFSSQTWSKSDTDAQYAIYQAITNYANANNLKIVNIGKMEDGLVYGVGIPVIFERVKFTD